MDFQLFIEFGWVLLVLVLLEGVLAADNALVMAVMVKHLPEEKRKKALFYGLLGAFLLRFASLFVITLLIDIWQVQALGAAYLLWISVHHIYKKKKGKKKEEDADSKGKGFWATVLKVELADMAFAVDSILAAVALAVSLPATSLPSIGGMDGGQFLVVLAGGLIGIVIMRFAAHKFVNLLKTRPGLETAAFLIVGWVGVKLTVHVLAHPSLHVLPHHFAESLLWKLTFYLVLVAIALIGWFSSSAKNVAPASISQQS
ncbi:membrane protein [Pontibacillus halophilus JSM 076056 = DSM 19796]|uniref:Membrane protein n=1 Tax=Pontibacillus halophilus JSM 076056 = DSM 19796 TaxID=1385510 RepID=A0A0A5GGQ7_9BACI|nr:TerC family protein [Pontibacillus halophilus]KGX92421.1 membrane protein [Pontibacillus halophilus JSM 076056 = DSM 19796]